MISTAIANRYARALVDVAASDKAGVDPRKAQEELHSFAGAMHEAEDLRSIFASPSVSIKKKRGVIDLLAGSLGISRMVRNFVQVLNDHRRIEAVAQIAAAFDVLLDERLGFIRADITSARDLDKQQQAELSHELSSLTGKTVRMYYSVNPDLIGGVVARIGSTVYDGSVRGQLTTIERRLAQ